jgi:putative transposase
MRQAVSISERRACRLVGLSRSTLRRVIAEEPATVSLKARIIDLAHARRRFGYRRIHDLLRREGVHANHKKVYRLYQQAALSVRKRRRRKGVMVDRQALHVPIGPNEVWSIDFVMDALANGRRIKCLTIVDDFTRECLKIAVDHGISGWLRRARARDHIAVSRGAACDPDRSRARVHQPSA